LFIAEGDAGLVGPLRFRGDCRGFERTAGGPDSRESITVNFETGQLSVYTNYSCRTNGRCFTAERLGVNPPPVTDECGTAEQPPSVAPCHAAMEKASPRNVFPVTEEDGELRIRYSLINSAAPSWSPTPTIDGQITLTPSAESSRVRVCFDGDPYPSGEIYRSGRTSPLATWEEHGALGVPSLGLFSVFRDRHVCGSG
jgi:hypothetical protein